MQGRTAQAQDTLHRTEETLFAPEPGSGYELLPRRFAPAVGLIWAPHPCEATQRHMDDPLDHAL
jgi:hypothetical protein